ncbi:hypothetical protein [Rhodopirellula sp. MGV]|nr:hypothetical protein [Rhodopirellula sp. MGV]
MDENQSGVDTILIVRTNNQATLNFAVASRFDPDELVLFGNLRTMAE